MKGMTEEFKNEIAELAELLEDVKKRTEIFSDYWTGKDSEEVMPNLLELEKGFGGINGDNKEYAASLDRILELYENYDKSVSKNVDTGDQSLDINK